MSDQDPSLISEWQPAITNISEEEKIVIKSNSSLYDKIKNMKEESKKTEEQIIEEFKIIEKEIESELDGIKR